MADQRIYDVIIVGAGPAGSMAAMRLARMGVDVLVLDRARFPRDKPCGGGLTPKSFRQLDFDIGDLVLHRADRVYLKGPRLAPTLIATPNGEEVWMVHRREFDTRLVEVARARGAAIHEGEDVTRVETGAPSTSSTQALTRVETNRGTYHARVVIGADGAQSIVARQVSLRNERHHRDRVFALEVEVAVARDVLDGAAFVDYCLPRGYGWIFPRGAIYSIGVGSADLRVIHDLRAHLAEFMAERNLPVVGAARVVGHRIPVWTRHDPLHRDNVILVGDAAGLADALWGEGIAYALMSGQVAALTIWDYLTGAVADIGAYTTRIHNLLAPDLRTLWRLAQLVYGMPWVMFPLFARSQWMRKIAANVISGDLSRTHIWRCGCAEKPTRHDRGGRCDAVLSTLAPSCC